MRELCVPVESYALQGASPQAIVPTVQLPLPDSSISVAELIRRTLQQQLAELSVQGLLAAIAVREIIARQYLSAAEIRAQAGQGAVRVPRVSEPAIPEFDVEREVERAWAGFERRAFRVVVDGRMPQALTDTVTIRADSKVAFMRLLPLVGG